MNRVAIIFSLVVALLFADTTATYFWPIPGGDKIVISNLGDYRPETSPAHFHAGIDIPTDTVDYKEDVWTITLSFRVDTIIHKDYTGIGYIVKVQHFSNDTTKELSHGSRYIHMNDIEPDLQIGSVYIGDLISYQTTFWQNHLHLDYRRPHSLSGSNVINPFVLPILQVDDTLKPILNHLYVDYSCHGDADVENLNFLSYEFDTLYGDTMGGGITFTKLKLPTESPDNDLDDPHILISGNRKARFVLGGHDNFYSTTDRGAPYELSLFLFDADSLGVRQKSYYTLRFDSLLGSPDEVHQEEDVYHVSAPLISDIGAPQYYRLYPCDSVISGLPGCVITGTAELKTEDLDEGMHRIKIYAKDYENNTKTADVHFYIRKSDWVDFCRGFKE